MIESSPRVQGLLAANKTFAESYVTPPMMPQVRANATEATICLTCMDPRVVPEEFVGPKPRIAVYRNAGGRYTRDAVRTVMVLRSLAYKAERTTLMIVHHTDCGMTHLTDSQIRKDIETRNPEETDSMDHFGCFAAEDLEKSVRDDVAAFRAESLLKGVEVRGYVLSTETGLLRELE